MCVQVQGREAPGDARVWQVLGQLQALQGQDAAAADAFAHAFSLTSHQVGLHMSDLSGWLRADAHQPLSWCLTSDRAAVGIFRPCKIWASTSVWPVSFVQLHHEGLKHFQHALC